LSILGLASCFGSTVSNLFVTSVDVTPANPSIVIAGTQAFILNVTFVDGTTDHENPNDTTWTSSNTAVATINRMGIATGVAPGTTTIGGSFQGNVAHTVLTVTNLQPGIAVRGDSSTLFVTNLATQQRLQFAANKLSDSVTISSGDDNADAGETASGGASATDAARNSSLERDGLTSAAFSVHPEQGPAWIAVDPAGKFLFVVNQTSESVSVFSIDWKNTALNAVAGSPIRDVGAKPLSVAVDADGEHVSVSHLENKDVSRFRIDVLNGALTPEQQ
jgi:Lactonase, 7-bladed beta-propeller/Bacterial Ig-like domain (group 2)